MSQDNITQSVHDHFQRTLAMFKEAILAFPPDEWHRGDTAYLRPAGVAYHVVETLDFYTGDDPPEAFPWGGRFGVSWEEGRSELLPTQEQVIAYLDDIEEKIERWFEETDLLAPEQTFPWTGPTALSRAIYILRNTQHHLAEMCIELTRRGYPCPEWR